jgi:hypothetical protein
MKRIVIKVIGGILCLLLVLAVVMPYFGKARYRSVRWREMNLERWHAAVIKLHDQNLPLDLFNAYVQSYNDLYTTDFSLMIQSATLGKLREDTQKDKSAFQGWVEYRIIYFKDNQWFIMEYPRS